MDAYGIAGKIGVKAIRPLLKDPIDEGCRPVLFAATSEDVVKEGIQGQYVSLSLSLFRHGCELEMKNSLEKKGWVVYVRYILTYLVDCT